nr:unnamed protein product [Callosobruchus analis]
MGDVGDPSGASGGSSCSTPSNNNHQSCASEMCRQQQPPGVVPLPLHRPPTPHSSFEHHIPKLESPSTPPSRPPASASAGWGCRTTEAEPRTRWADPRIAGVADSESRTGFTCRRWTDGGTPPVYSVASVGGPWTGISPVSPGTGTSTVRKTTIGKRKGFLFSCRVV